MNVTIDLKALLIVVAIIAIIVLIVYLVRFFRDMSVTLKHTNKILEDVEVITDIAADRSKDVDKIISDVSESVSDITDAVKGKQDVISVVSSVVKAAMAVKNSVDKSKD